MGVQRHQIPPNHRHPFFTPYCRHFPYLKAPKEGSTPFFPAQIIPPHLRSVFQSGWPINFRASPGSILCFTACVGRQTSVPFDLVEIKDPQIRNQKTTNQRPYPTLQKHPPPPPPPRCNLIVSYITLLPVAPRSCTFDRFGPSQKRVQMWSNRLTADSSRLGFTRDSHYTTLPPLNPLPVFSSWPTNCKDQRDNQGPAKHCPFNNSKDATPGSYKMWEAPAIKDHRFETHPDPHFSFTRNPSHNSHNYPPIDVVSAPSRVLSLPKLNEQILQLPHRPQLNPGFYHPRQDDCIRHKSFSLSLQPPEAANYLHKHRTDLHRSHSEYFRQENAGFLSELHLQYPPPRLSNVPPLKRRADNFHTFVEASPHTHSINSKKHKVTKLCKDSQSKKPRRSMNTAAAVVNYPIKPHSFNNLPYTALQIINSIYSTIVEKKYSAPVLDPRNPSLYVFEYPIGDHWVIWNYCTGMVHLTGLWRAAIQEGIYGIEDYSLPHFSNLGLEDKSSLEQGEYQQQRIMRILIKPNAKADIAKLLESTPRSLQLCIKRVRGGFLKIQGTWITYPLCKILATRFAYYIRYHLVPIFGSDFPALCLPPLDPNFGELEFNSDILQLIQFASLPLPLMPMSPLLPQLQNQVDTQPRNGIQEAIASSQMAFNNNRSCSPDSVTLGKPISSLYSTFDGKMEKKVAVGCDVELGLALNAHPPEVMKIASLLT